MQVLKTFPPNSLILLLQVEEFLDGPEANRFLEALLQELELEQKEISLFGKTLLQPRLIGYYGDPVAQYTYSRKTLNPKPWTPTLMTLRKRLEGFTGSSFNSVLVNLYRDGRDSMGWHADDEPELGQEPLVASLSLGAERPIHFKPKKGISAPNLLVPQPHGSLLIMAGPTQNNWVHCIKKNNSREPRMNLTFRNIIKFV